VEVAAEYEEEVDGVVSEGTEQSEEVTLEVCSSWTRALTSLTLARVTTRNWDSLLKLICAPSAMLAA
jgi:hypothetical protein